MLRRMQETRPKEMLRRFSPMHLALLISLMGLLLLACGVESGDRRPARADDDKTGEFHRSPVAAFEQFRVDVAKTDEGCTVSPSDITVGVGGRVSLAVQLTGASLTTTETGSTKMEGERQTATYQIQGLTISSSGGAFGTGVTEVDLDLETGTRRTYQFSTPTAGAFDILCDGNKIGTFTVN